MHLNIIAHAWISRDSRFRNIHEDSNAVNGIQCTYVPVYYIISVLIVRFKFNDRVGVIIRTLLQCDNS